MLNIFIYLYFKQTKTDKMNKLIALIEVLENKQENGTITMSEQAIFCKLIEKAKDMLDNN